jgi:hypothetical protein
MCTSRTRGGPRFRKAESARKLCLVALALPLWLPACAEVRQLGSTIPQNLHKRAASWDEALAPISCKDLHPGTLYWSITGSVIAEGVLYSDGPITDPAAIGAIGRKFAGHIGPGC